MYLHYSPDSYDVLIGNSYVAMRVPLSDVASYWYHTAITLPDIVRFYQMLNI
jgi:hypothetical protein